MCLVQAKESRNLPIPILVAQDIDLFSSLSQHNHNDVTQRQSGMGCPGANVPPMPEASHWLTVSLLHRPSATHICSQRLLLRKPRGLQLKAYLHTVLCNDAGIAKPPCLVFSFFVLCFPSYLHVHQWYKTAVKHCWANTTVLCVL